MSEETTTEQLAAIEGQAAEYTPPEGWRVLQVGEALREGDVIVHKHDAMYATARAGGWVGANQRYIRPIEPEPQAEPVQVREGRWRTRSGQEFRVSPMPTDHWDFAPEYRWWDGNVTTWRTDGRFSVHQNAMDLIEYLGPIEPQPEPEQEPQPEPESDTELQAQVAFLKGREVTLGTRLQQERDVTTRLRGELESVQVMLGESRQRVTQLEELVASLRTINEGAEKAVSGAGAVNDSLRLQLAAVKAELASVAADRQRLQIELDAAQQVPADSPELRQLRADLEQVTRERDQYLDSYQRIFGDLETIRETTKAAAVEAIAEWLEPIRAVDNEHLANETLQHLPQIMRHLTGLAQD